MNRLQAIAQTGKDLASGLRCMMDSIDYVTPTTDTMDFNNGLFFTWVYMNDDGTFTVDSGIYSPPLMSPNLEDQTETARKILDFLQQNTAPTDISPTGTEEELKAHLLDVIANHPLITTPEFGNEALGIQLRDGINWYYKNKEL